MGASLLALAKSVYYSKHTVIYTLSLVVLWYTLMPPKKHLT